ncbi:putative E3 ubiquitin ligase SUD1 [Camellia lanceoleosa]|uniref:E3 ubiquitin ligase SUD1 n=1 Tax=Camellia lanceoleosa TaxID=1840588 RepID=A0ACC0J1R9_9ERIC|nr:putative E3 ubiquitin ligase SUD1 [Camellia lanceoleosa]
MEMERIFGGVQGIAESSNNRKESLKMLSIGRFSTCLEAQVEQMFDGLDDADGAEDVPFDELVGMQGPVFSFGGKCIHCSCKQYDIPWCCNLCALFIGTDYTSSCIMAFVFCC